MIKYSKKNNSLIWGIILIVISILFYIFNRTSFNENFFEEKNTHIINLLLSAGRATPAPPVGTALSPYSVNIMDFCNKFNKATSDKKGQKILVEITVKEGGSFTFITKTPPSSLILKAVKDNKGQKVSHNTNVTNITMDQVRNIANTYMNNHNVNNINEAIKIVKGTARSMGITVS